MAEYIKLEPLREEIFNDDFDCDIINHFLNIVDSQPTADVVEVVRCKDCQSYSDFYTTKCKRLEFHFCEKFRNITKESDFCSYGEKKGCANNG